MSWRLVYTPPAQRDLRRLDRREAARVVAALERLAESGHGDVRRLTGRVEYRLRVGEVRVLFRYEDIQAGDEWLPAISVRRVLPRGRAYRDP